MENWNKKLKIKNEKMRMENYELSITNYERLRRRELVLGLSLFHSNIMQRALAMRKIFDLLGVGARQCSDFLKNCAKTIEGDSETRANSKFYHFYISAT